MKKRIKIDSSILSFIIILTGLLYMFPGLYAGNYAVDTIFDCLGLIAIIKGTLLRMIGRGHKKATSKLSNKLVTDGPYLICRNPMYLGSYLIGAGFALIVWPWWMIPLFTGMFYIRFNVQVKKEEEFLRSTFGQEYETFCKNVPRVFPSIMKMRTVKIKQIINWDELFSTQEINGLWGWPLLALVLESIQEQLIYGSTDIFQTTLQFLSTMAIFGILLVFAYQKNW